ncbi:unnamed protein product [Protopolystoma xenopodis]|uniref:Uncharacterized protein n=1 Tax=Protopolystoma xenopodis TaxID=117903 RepID=A0A3S5AJ51_9PLAT|nr:unnamed protein product [Protopolystoma xenopodis]
MHGNLDLPAYPRTQPPYSSGQVSVSHVGLECTWNIHLPVINFIGTDSATTGENLNRSFGFGPSRHHHLLFMLDLSQAVEQIQRYQKSKDFSTIQAGCYMWIKVKL